MKPRTERIEDKLLALGRGNMSITDELREYQKYAESTIERLCGQLRRSYIKDKTGREIMCGDKVSGLFYHGLPVVGTCVFSRQEAAWGVEWMRGGTKEFIAFCKCCNVEWEVIEK